MNLTEKIKYHCDNKKYCKVYRKVGKNSIEKTDGFIVDYSNEFLILQNVGDFFIYGYIIIPIKTIQKIRFNDCDKYFDKMCRLEGITDKIGNENKVDLSSWKSIFETIKILGFNVIIENENPDDETFDIGPIIEIDETSVTIRHFNAKGYLDEEPTKINWSLITIVKFDDNYINTFSKYLRERKTKK